MAHCGRVSVSLNLYTALTCVLWFMTVASYNHCKPKISLIVFRFIFAGIQMSVKGKTKGGVSGYSDWMSQLPAELHNIPLFNLAIPGKKLKLENYLQCCSNTLLHPSLLIVNVMKITTVSRSQSTILPQNSIQVQHLSKSIFTCYQ